MSHSILDEAVFNWKYDEARGVSAQWSALVVLWLRAAGIHAETAPLGRVFCPLAMDFFAPNRPTMKGWCEEMGRLGDLQIMYERPRPGA